jgi:hypothetical protein
LRKLALFGPDILNTSAVAARIVSVALCALVSLCGKALVHVALDIIAASNDLVQESLSVTLVKSSHDLFAVCVISISIGNGGMGLLKGSSGYGGLDILAL